jgi:hypothetical protein
MWNYFPNKVEWFNFTTPNPRERALIKDAREANRGEWSKVGFVLHKM